MSCWVDSVHLVEFGPYFKCCVQFGCIWASLRSLKLNCDCRSGWLSALFPLGRVAPEADPDPVHSPNKALTSRVNLYILSNSMNAELTRGFVLKMPLFHAIHHIQPCPRTHRNHLHLQLLLPSRPQRCALESAKSSAITGAGTPLVCRIHT
jgi:hypothetical protein